MNSPIIIKSKPPYLFYEKIEIKFCGHIFWLYADGSCFHPKSSTLIVADLHLEKAFSQSRAALLPGYDTKQTLELLEAALNRNLTRNCVFLGDSFHNSMTAQSLADPYREKLQQLSEINHFTWVIGNHDPILPNFLIGEQCHSTFIDNIELRHQLERQGYKEPITQESGQIIGHYHPKAKLKLRAGKASGKCFIFDKKLMIIPAFGVSTGGLNITDKAISKLFSNTPDVYFCYKTKLYHIHDVANLCK